VSKNNLGQLVRKNIQNSIEHEVPKSKKPELIRQTGTRRIKNAKWIPIDKICPDPEQPRKSFPEETLHELAQSIKEHGIRQPIVVEYVENDDCFQIVHGERRYRAAKLAVVQELPCIVQNKTARLHCFALQLVENIQREDLSPIDKARALLEYKEEFGDNSTWVDVEKTVGISQTRR